MAGTEVVASAEGLKPAPRFALGTETQQKGPGEGKVWKLSTGDELSTGSFTPCSWHGVKQELNEVG